MQEKTISKQVIKLIDAFLKSYISILQIAYLTNKWHTVESVKEVTVITDRMTDGINASAEHERKQKWQM